MFKIWESEKNRIQTYKLPDGRTYDVVEKDGDLWQAWWTTARDLGKVLDYHPFETLERPLTSLIGLTEVFSNPVEKSDFKRTLMETRKRVRDQRFDDEVNAKRFLRNVAWTLRL